ncbi:unnamed protein product, partial [Hymenolepis diminuta]
QTCEDIFQNDLTEIPDDLNIRLLLPRLGLAENKTFIHPRTISGPKFDETVSILHFVLVRSRPNFESVSNVFLSLKSMIKNG